MTSPSRVCDGGVIEDYKGRSRAGDGGVFAKMENVSSQFDPFCRHGTLVWQLQKRLQHVG